MTFLNKKGFFMTETLMVIVFATIIFTFLYISVIPLIGTYNDKILRESDIDIVYKLYSIRKMINKDVNKKLIINDDVNVKEINCNDFNNKEYCTELLKYLELNNSTLVYTNDIKENYNDLINIDSRINSYLKDYKDEEENALILLDKKKNTIAHLSYIDPDMNLGDLLEYKANKKSKKTKNVCKPLYLDSDGINYFSGTNECVDFNYVWYSGKLWRITAIYPDGTLKMMTERNIVAMPYDECAGRIPGRDTVRFEGSYAYQWLNEDFLDTLYNYSEIIDTTKSFDASVMTSYRVKPSNTTIVHANVGLLNPYEFYISNYNNPNNTYDDDGYLNTQSKWWLLNPYNTEEINVVSRYFGYNTSSIKHATPANSHYDMLYSFGIRPVIYIKGDIKFTGSGTKETPYRLVGDKTGGQKGDLINTRLSGEYIKLKNGNNEQVFRIVDTNDNKTKIVSLDVDTSASKSFTRWVNYLKSTYYSNVVDTYGELFDEGLYYRGYSGNNYKLAICSSATSDTTKDCEKTTMRGNYYAGLLRLGEMFASITNYETSSNDSSRKILFNLYDSSHIWEIHEQCGQSCYPDEYETNINSYKTVFPTLHLKSSIKIKSGKGTENDPYIVGL